MTTNPQQGRLPFTVLLAATLLALYLVVLLGNAYFYAVSSGDWSSFVLSLPRTILTLAVAVGLLNRQAWAWWLAVIGGSLTVVTTMLSLTALNYTQSHGLLQFSPMWRYVLWMYLATLTPAVLLLFSDSARVALLVPKPTGFVDTQPPIPDVPKGPWS